MFTIQEIGKAVHVRRQAVGLTQDRLAKLTHLSRQTVQNLENGTIKDLSFGRLSNVLSILGMNWDAPTTTARERKKGLWMAAKNASVSYKRDLTPETLQSALVSGEVPAGVESNLLHFLEEAPLQLVVLAAEEVAQASPEPTAVWKNITKLGQKLGAHRKELA